MYCYDYNTVAKEERSFNMDKLNKYYKIFMALFELLLAVPFLGATIVISTGWSILGLLMFLHILGILFSVMTNQRKSGHFIGIIANFVAFIPLVGMAVHTITGCILLIQGMTTKTQNVDKEY